MALGRYPLPLTAPLILGTNDLDAGPYRVLEGNCRAVALAIVGERAGLESVPVFVALSPTVRLRDWRAIAAEQESSPDSDASLP